MINNRITRPRIWIAGAIIPENYLARKLAGELTF